MTISRQKVVGILRAKGFEGAKIAKHRVTCPGFHVSQWGTDAGNVIGVYYRDWPYPMHHVVGTPSPYELPNLYLAALVAAGIQARLSTDGGTVVVPVEQERRG